MAMFDSSKAPWPFKWLLIGIVSLPFMPVLSSLYGAARTGSQEAADGIDSAADDTFGSSETEGASPAVRTPEPVRFYWCSGTPPSLESIAAADATPDLYDSPLNRLDCDGWIYPDGTYVLSDAGRDALGLVLSITPGAMPSVDVSGQVIQQRTQQPVGEPSVVQPGQTTPQADDQGGGRSVFGWALTILWVGVRVVLVVLAAWLLFVLLRWPYRRLRSSFKGRARDAGGDYVNDAGQRVAFNDAAESGTSPDLLDDCPDPPDSPPVRPLFPVPTGGSPDPAQIHPDDADDWR